jgi:hypothetical protein
VVSTKLRFICGTAGTFNISCNNLLDLLNFPTIAGVTAYRLCSTFKIKSLEMWAAAPSSGVPTTNSLEWVDNTTSSAASRINVSDTTMGTAKPLHVYSKPSKMSTVGFWQGGGNQIAFTLNLGAAYTIIDLGISFVLNDINSPVAATSTVPGTASVNTVCCKSLDGGNVILPYTFNID